MKFVYVWLLLVIAKGFLPNVSCELKMVTILFRHGDRTPTNLYPKDPHLNYSWPGGFGVLTTKGKAQNFRLGQIMFEKYSKYMPLNVSNYQESLFVKSSSIERCLTAARSFLDGFLNASKESSVISNDIPIDYLPLEQDDLLAQQKPCVKYDTILSNLYKNPKMKMNRENRKLFPYLTKHTGMKINSILDVQILYDTLLIQRNNNLMLPLWTNQIFPQPLLRLSKRSMALLTESFYMKQVKAGPLITEINDNVDRMVNGLSQSDFSLFAYSAHDITMVNLMRTLGIAGQTSDQPDYASALVFEFHQNGSNKEDFLVNAFYYFSSKDGNPKRVEPVKYCSNPCTLKSLRKNIKGFILKDFSKICDNKL